MRNPLVAAARSLTPQQVKAEAPVPVGDASRNIFGSMLSSRAGAARDSMETSGLVFQIIDTRRRHMAKVQWELVQLPKPRVAMSDFSTGQLLDRPHPAMQLIRGRVNPFWPWAEFVQMWSTWYDMVGEAFITWTPGPAGPSELWLYPPHRMIERPDPTEFLLGWSFRDATGKEHGVAPDEVHLARRPHPTNLYRGIGPLQAAVTDIDVSRKSAEWNLNFFDNSSLPAAVIEIDADLSDAQFTRLESQLNENHSGVSNAHRTLIAEHGSYNFRQFTPKEMEFTEGRKLSDDQIRTAFGISKTALGQNEDVVRATAITARTLEVENHLVPKADLMAAFLNETLLPMYPGSERLAFRYVDPAPVDPEDVARKNEHNLQIFSQYVAVGADPAVVAETLGMPPIEVTAATSEPGDTGRRPPLARHLAQLRAAVEVPTDEEVLEDYQADFDAALEAFLIGYGAVKLAMISGVVDQIKSALTAGNYAAIGDVEADSGDLAALLSGLLVDLDASSRRAAAAEVEDATGETVPDDEIADDDEGVPLVESAIITAGIIAGFFAASAAKETQRLTGGEGIDPDEVVEDVASFLAGLKDTAAVDAVHQVFTGVQNRARTAVFEVALRTGRFVLKATEAMDKNTCGPCRKVDGTRFGSTAEARKAYPDGGFKDCEGRARCRGTVRLVKA